MCGEKRDELWDMFERCNLAVCVCEAKVERKVRFGRMKGRISGVMACE